MNQQQRYEIIENYNGLFDDMKIIASTDSLFNAVTLIRYLKAFTNVNPCYSFEFRKIDDKLDDDLDWFPCGGLFDFGKVIDCKTYEEFLAVSKLRE